MFYNFKGFAVNTDKIISIRKVSTYDIEINYVTSQGCHFETISYPSEEARDFAYTMFISKTERK